MMGCDQAPRLAMPASFIFGFQMAISLGLLTAPVWLVVLVWMLCLAWFANVLVLHLHAGKPFAARLAAIDFRFRFAVIGILVSVAIHGLAGASYLADDRMAWKMLVFAGLVGCGVLIRRHLKPFAPAFASLIANGSTPEVEDTLEQTVARCQPYVALIWLGLLVNAAIGIRLL